MIKLSTSFALTLLISCVAMASETGAHEAKPGVFDGTMIQSIAAIIVFLVLFAILYKMAWGPILTGLQDRENKIKDDLAQAQKASEDAKQTLASYEQKLADAQAETRKLIDQARQEALALGQQLKDQTQQDITQMRERAEVELRSAREQAVNELYAQAAELSTQIAGHILKRQLNPADQQTIIEESLEQLRQASNN